MTWQDAGWLAIGFLCGLWVWAFVTGVRYRGTK